MYHGAGTPTYKVTEECHAGSPLHRENRYKKRNSTWNLQILQKTQGILFAQVVNFHDSKVKEYCDIFHNKFQFFFYKAGYVCHGEMG